MAQVNQERVLRGQKGILVDNFQSGSDGDGSVLVMVVMVVVMLARDIWPIVDPEERLSLRAVSHSQLHTPAPRLQSLDQASEVGSAMDLIIQQVGAVRGAASKTSNISTAYRRHTHHSFRWQ